MVAERQLESVGGCAALGFQCDNLPVTVPFLEHTEGEVCALSIVCFRCVSFAGGFGTIYLKNN